MCCYAVLSSGDYLKQSSRQAPFLSRLLLSSWSCFPSAAGGCRSALDSRAHLPTLLKDKHCSQSVCLPGMSV